MKSKIVHLTSVHSRYDNRIFLKECCTLSKNYNFEVSLIVADSKGDEFKNNVSIYDIGKLEGRIKRMLQTTDLIFKKAVELDADVYHFHDPELISVGIKLKKLGKKVIYDIHEMTDQVILTKKWIPSFLRSSISILFKKYELRACEKFDYLIVPQPIMVKLYSRYANTEAVCNFVNSLHFKKKDYIGKRSNTKITAIHAGALTESRGLFNMINTFSSIKNAKLILAGPFEEEKNKIIVEESINVDYRGILSLEDVNKLSDESDIGIILYNNVGQYHLSFAVKLFEYMLKGMPVIMPNFGEWVDFNNKFKCGINVDVMDPLSIKMAINELSEDDELFNRLSSNGVLAAKENFTWESQEIILNKIYKDVLNVK